MALNIIIILALIVGAIVLLLLANLLVFSKKAREIGIFIGICSLLLILMITMGCSQYVCPTYADRSEIVTHC